MKDITNVVPGHFRDVCQYGYVHMQCRCPAKDKSENRIACTKPERHGQQPGQFGLEMPMSVGPTQVKAAKVQPSFLPGDVVKIHHMGRELLFQVVDGDNLPDGVELKLEGPL